ncbi:protein tyrosine phosphatase [Enterobacter sp.]|uniref:arsenate reductase/protein-tyrosine-phosphatase family protein n=1 Tax=Enterobacter sp. TaxID=42895 RepID=UPI0031E02127
MFNSILVVCTGNICRSPVGEQFLRQLIPDIRIDSAGIRGLTGSPADSRAQEVAAQLGISLETHVARRVTPQMIHDYDLILTMVPDQLNKISAMVPEARGKTFLYGQWLGIRDIPDPYCKSYAVFEYVFSILGRASQEWAQRLN